MQRDGWAPGLTFGLHQVASRIYPRALAALFLHQKLDGSFCAESAARVRDSIFFLFGGLPEEGAGKRPAPESGEEIGCAGQGPGGPGPEGRAVGTQGALIRISETGQGPPVVAVVSEQWDVLPAVAWRASRLCRLAVTPANGERESARAVRRRCASTAGTLQVQLAFDFEKLAAYADANANASST